MGAWWLPALPSSDLDRSWWVLADSSIFPAPYRECRTLAVGRCIRFGSNSPAVEHFLHHYVWLDHAWTRVLAPSRIWSGSASRDDSTSALGEHQRSRWAFAQRVCPSISAAFQSGLHQHTPGDPDG